MNRNLVSRAGYVIKINDSFTSLDIHHLVNHLLLQTAFCTDSQRPQSLFIKLRSNKYVVTTFLLLNNVLYSELPIPPIRTVRIIQYDICWTRWLRLVTLQRIHHHTGARLNTTGSIHSLSNLGIGQRCHLCSIEIGRDIAARAMENYP